MSLLGMRRCIFLFMSFYGRVLNNHVCKIIEQYFYLHNFLYSQVIAGRAAPASATGIPKNAHGTFVKVVFTKQKVKRDADFGMTSIESYADCIGLPVTSRTKLSFFRLFISASKRACVGECEQRFGFKAATKLTRSITG